MPAPAIPDGDPIDRNALVGSHRSVTRAFGIGGSHALPYRPRPRSVGLACGLSVRYNRDPALTFAHIRCTALQKWLVSPSAGAGKRRKTVFFKQ